MCATCQLRKLPIATTHFPLIDQEEASLYAYQLEMRGGNGLFIKSHGHSNETVIVPSNYLIERPLHNWLLG